jgi:hypothetical protein
VAPRLLTTHLDSATPRPPDQQIGRHNTPIPEPPRTARLGAGSRTLTVTIVVLDVHLSCRIEGAGTVLEVAMPGVFMRVGIHRRRPGRVLPDMSHESTHDFPLERRSPMEHTGAMWIIVPIVSLLAAIALAYTLRTRLPGRSEGDIDDADPTRDRFGRSQRDRLRSGMRRMKDGGLDTTSIEEYRGSACVMRDRMAMRAWARRTV